MKKTLILSSLMAATAVSAADPLGDYSRANRWEVYAQGFYLTGGNDTDFGGLSLEFDSGFGGGVGFGYNLSDHWNLNTEIGGGTTDFDASGFGGTATGDATLFVWNVNVDYNILKKRLTPFVTAGVGLLHMDGDASGPGPLLGVDISQTGASWNVGGGLRWDISDRVFAKVAYRATWAFLQDADNVSFFHGANLGVGMKF